MTHDELVNEAVLAIEVPLMQSGQARSSWQWSGSAKRRRANLKPKVSRIIDEIQHCWVGEEFETREDLEAAVRLGFSWITILLWGLQILIPLVVQWWWNRMQAATEVV